MHRRLDTDIVIARIAEAAIRHAAGLNYSLDSVPRAFEDIAREIVKELAEQLVVSDSRGILRCGLCGKGPFTRKGLYLHLRRVHIDTVEDMAKRLLEEKLWSLREEKPPLQPA
jgi:hypothetical protein